MLMFVALKGALYVREGPTYKLDQLRAGVPPEPSNFVTGFFEQISFVRGCDLVIMIDFMNLVLSI